MSDQPQAQDGQSLAVKIDSEKGHPLAWKAVVKRAAMVLVAGLIIYLVFPAITEVLAGPIAYGAFRLRYGSHRPSSPASAVKT